MSFVRFRLLGLALGANSRFLRVEFRFTSRENRVLRLVLSRGGGPQTYTLHDQIPSCCHVLVFQCFYLLLDRQIDVASANRVEKSAGGAVGEDVAICVLADVAVGVPQGRSLNQLRNKGVRALFDVAADGTERFGEPGMFVGRLGNYLGLFWGSKKLLVRRQASSTPGVRPGLVGGLPGQGSWESWDSIEFCGEIARARE